MPGPNSMRVSLMTAKLRMVSSTSIDGVPGCLLRRVAFQEAGHAVQPAAGLDQLADIDFEAGDTSFLIARFHLRRASWHQDLARFEGHEVHRQAVVGL